MFGKDKLKYSNIEIQKRGFTPLIYLELHIFLTTFVMMSILCSSTKCKSLDGGGGKWLAINYIYRCQGVRSMHICKQYERIRILKIDSNGRKTTEELVRNALFIQNRA